MSLVIFASLHRSRSSSRRPSVHRHMADERGQALLETAMVVPILLLVSVAIFEFGRAYQTWEVLTNAAREGARVAVIPNPGSGAPEQTARNYMEWGGLPNFGAATVTVDRTVAMNLGGMSASASQVTIDYPFDFMVLGPVARLVTSSSTVGGPLTMRATATMRNEQP